MYTAILIDLQVLLAWQQLGLIIFISCRIVMYINPLIELIVRWDNKDRDLLFG